MKEYIHITIEWLGVYSRFDVKKSKASLLTGEQAVIQSLKGDGIIFSVKEAKDLINMFNRIVREENVLRPFTPEEIADTLKYIVVDVAVQHGVGFTRKDVFNFFGYTKTNNTDE